MLTIGDPVEQLRFASLQNNIAWLRSFGCDVFETDGYLQVWHGELPEFRALVLIPADVGGAADCTAGVRWAIDRRAAIYVDSEVSDRCNLVMKTAGFRLDRQNRVDATRASRRPVSGKSLEMRRVGPDAIDTWSTLYSFVFGRAEDLGAIDLKRWRLACANPEMDFFFFEQDGEHIGVCQMCRSHDLAGVYSLGLVPAARNRRLLREVAVEIGSAALDCGLEVVYFERSRPAYAQSKPAPLSYRRGRRTLRNLLVWVL